MRFPIRVVSAGQARSLMTRLDDYELNDERDRLADRLGTYWADA